MLWGGAEREARATAVLAVRPVRNSDKLLLAWGQMYSLEKPDHISVRLKVEHSGFGTLNDQRFGSKFFEEVAKPSNSELTWLAQSFILYISGN